MAGQEGKSALSFPWQAALWMLFCAMAVAVRGVRWDENYEFAQVLTGQVVYPEGHPLVVYLHSVFSGQTWLTALMMRCGAGPALVCGFRNVLFLLAGILPPYLFTVFLTGRVRWGCLAAVLTLEGVLMEFDGSYPIRVWPDLYSNGQVGDAWALLTLFALLTGGWRLAAGLAGALPAVHVGQVPGIGVLGLLWMGGAWRRGECGAIRRALPWGMAALALCAALYLLTLSSMPDWPESGVVTAAGQPEAIWQGFVAHEDPHRRFPAGNAQVLLVGTLLLAARARQRETNPARRRVYGGILLYTGVVAGITWMTMAVHYETQPAPPVWLLQWLPYRPVNHVAPLFLAVAVSVLANRPRTRPVPVLLLAFALLRPWMAWFTGEAVWRAYLFNGEAVAFALFGAALAVLLYDDGGRPLRGWLALGAAAVLAPYHQFGAVCVAGGVALAFAPDLWRMRRMDRLGGAWAAGAVCAVSAAFMLQNQWTHREHLARSGLDRAVAQVLDTQALPSSPLIAPLDTYALQARLDHPVLIDAATGSFLTYLPRLGPAIQGIYEDVYGIRFDGAGGNIPWERVWAERSADSWAALGKRYGAQFLLSPAGIPLQLPGTACVLEADGARLYRLYETP